MSDDDKQSMTEVSLPIDYLKMEAMLRQELMDDIGVEIATKWMEDKFLGEWKLRVSAQFPAYTIAREAYPRDWWEAFKHRWFPAWALRRWPVSWKTIEVKQMLQDIIPMRDHRSAFYVMVDKSMSEIVVKCPSCGNTRKGTWGTGTAFCHPCTQRMEAGF